MMLYFGSFNPIHNGHIALAEYVVEQDLCDEVALMISPQSPHKIDTAQAPEMDRYEMAELACKASKYPDKIRPSVVEFLLPKPSYTINTLRYLSENFDDQMQLSILLGADQLDRLDTWKEYEKVLDYPMYIYPRLGGVMPQKFADRITMLEDAPLHNISSTEVRRRVEAGEDTSTMISKDVAEYIRKKGLWSAAVRIAMLNSQLEAEPENVELLLERGKLHYRHNEWGAALNDFNTVLRLNPQHEEARQFIEMVQEILEFRYTDIYNP